MSTHIVEISKEVITKVCVSFPDEWTNDQIIAKLSRASTVDDLLKVDSLKWETYEGPFFCDCNETEENSKIDYVFK